MPSASVDVVEDSGDNRMTIAARTVGIAVGRIATWNVYLFDISVVNRG
jgi:hypothetical protein